MVMRVKKKNRLNLFAACFCFFMLLDSSRGVASDEWRFLKITCIPEFEYFSITSFAIGDYYALPLDKAVATGMYTARQLVKSPVECQLQHRKISVVSTYHKEPKPTGGACAGSEWATFSVRYDGDEVARIMSGGRDGRGCWSQDYKSEIVLSPAKQENCTSYSVMHTDAVAMQCTPIDIKNWYKNAK